MKVETQTFLELVEKANKLCFFDLEATGLRGDYNSILVASVLPFSVNPITLQIQQPGNDQKLVRELKELLESFELWVTYYGKGFDIPMLNTRLLKWNRKPVDKKPHLDMYFTLKANLLTARKSQAHLLEWLNTPEQKMTVGADVWNQILFDVNGKAMKTMVSRCESDVIGLRDLYNKTKHVVKEIKT